MALHWRVERGVEILTAPLCSYDLIMVAHGNKTQLTEPKATQNMTNESNAFYLTSPYNNIQQYSVTTKINRLITYCHLKMALHFGQTGEGHCYYTKFHWGPKKPRLLCFLCGEKCSSMEYNLIKTMSFLYPYFCFKNIKPTQYNSMH